MNTKKLISLLLCSLIFFTQAGCNDNIQPNKTQPQIPVQVELSEAEKKDILTDAYVFTLPLMMEYATFIKATNTVNATNVQAPVNQFIHAANLATADFKDVVTPNVDTVYSQIFLELTDDAVVLEFPKADRFCTVEIMDAYTNCISLIDTTKFENESEKFIFTGTDFKDDIPDGMREIKCPTNLIWIIVRTICNDEADLVNIKAIQNKMDSYTLTQYKNHTTNEKPQGNFDVNNNFIPSNYVLSFSMQDYFELANKLLEKYPPFAADKSMTDKMKKINVGAGLKFDSNIFGENANEIWSELVKGISDTVTAGSIKFIEQNGCWSYMGAPIAEFGTEYAYRGLISLVGLGANPVSVAVYPKATNSTEGARLNGKDDYVIHFEKDGLPNVEEYGFWSITIYNSNNNFLIDNEIDRYCINDRNDVKFNADGSLDILISKDKPENGIENWLPTYEGDYHLVLRVYNPSDDVVNNTWAAPTITKK